MKTELIDLGRFEDERGILTVAEDFGFSAVRAFWIRGRKGEVRGRHAHYRCFQAIASIHGSVSVEIFDGWMVRKFILDGPPKMLLVPPMHWIEIRCQSVDPVVLVLCSEPYDKSDVIDDLGKFQELARS